MSVTKLLLDITFVRILLTVLSPFRSFVAWQLVCGRSLISFAVGIERSILRTAGWFSAPPKTHALRHLFLSLVDVRRWHVAAALLVVYSAVSAAVTAWRDSKDEHIQQRRHLEAKMAQSRSYYDWAITAAKLDSLEGVNQEQRWNTEIQIYDRKLLQDKVAHLRHVRDSDSGVMDQMFAVRADLMRNLGGITNSALHEHFPLVPAPIREYIDEVRLHLEEITASPELALAEKSAFLKETRHAFGRTALVLSGGGPLAAFHLGVVKALLEHGMLPRVLAGSSSGAVICALAATRTDAELTALLDNLNSFDLSFFSTATALQAIATALLPGSTAEAGLVVKRLRHLLGDLTFLDAYTQTGRVLSVSVCADGNGANEPARLLNYLTAPHVLIWSAVACSAALPGLTGPMELLARSADGELVCFHSSGDGVGEGGAARRWRDGSIEQELPLRGLSEMFSANHFIVSQTSLHVVPILNLKRQLGTVGQLAEQEFKHRCRQAAELVPRWAPGAASWLRRFSQPWEGDVTIVLPDSALQLRKSMMAPTHEELVEATRLGERCTWAKISAIQCNCGIESTLDACIQQVSTWERQERAKRRAVAMPLKAKCKSMADVRTALQGLAESGKKASDDSELYTATSGGDGTYFSPYDVHLPLPEERAYTPALNTGGGRKGGPKGRPAVSPLLREAAMECTDSSAMTFDIQGLGTPTSVTGEQVQSLLSAASTRNSLDFIAP